MNPGLMAAINMKLRKPLVAIAISLFALVSLSNTASAHSADDIPPALASILAKTAAIFNSLLDSWVNSATGNTLTDPAGTQLVGSLAQTVVSVVHFLAQFVTMF